MHPELVYLVLNHAQVVQRQCPCSVFSTIECKFPWLVESPSCKLKAFISIFVLQCIMSWLIWFLFNARNEGQLTSLYFVIVHPRPISSPFWIQPHISCNCKIINRPIIRLQHSYNYFKPRYCNGQLESSWLRPVLAVYGIGYWRDYVLTNSSFSFLIQEEIAREAETGKIYRTNYFDKHGRPVLVMRPRCQVLCSKLFLYLHEYSVFHKLGYYSRLEYFVGLWVAMSGILSCCKTVFIVNLFHLT